MHTVNDVDGDGLLRELGKFETKLSSGSNWHGQGVAGPRLLPGGVSQPGCMRGGVDLAVLVASSARQSRTVSGDVRDRENQPDR